MIALDGSRPRNVAILRRIAVQTVVAIVASVSLTSIMTVLFVGFILAGPLTPLPLAHRIVDIDHCASADLPFPCIPNEQPHAGPQRDA